jgi:hypothetical protein
MHVSYFFPLSTMMPVKSIFQGNKNVLFHFQFSEADSFSCSNESEEQ